ncbi:hypothetical protein CROQUDRAFT_708950 [Cronartium quercuum f. sp. fusiforme G11]|uniref:Uncharacterized protein n=1 Tax=Cronartium quercuum f. sp. fusiforme G11 TaxID=708437 RepID=A0A9P6T9X6_9BASI|nr:hypothetical protein CROQUDRAFT_708950 [Cronartium quercuum f. sp. fusiforme G11]
MILQRPFPFSSNDLNATLLRYSSYDGPPHEHRGPADYEIKVKTGLGQASNAPPSPDDDEDDEDDSDQIESKPQGGSPADADIKPFAAPTTISWPVSTYPPTASQPSWSYLHQHPTTSTSTSTCALVQQAVPLTSNLSLPSPSPSLASFACFPQSAEHSPAAMSSLQYPTSSESQNELHATTIAMSDGSTSRSRHPNVMHPVPSYVMRNCSYPPGIANESTWQLRPPTLLHVPTPSGGQTFVSNGSPHRSHTPIGTTATSHPTYQARTDSLDSTCYPLVAPEPFRDSYSSAEDATENFRPTDRHAYNPNNVPYYRRHTDTEIYEGPGADATVSGEQRGRPRSRVSDQHELPINLAQYNPHLGHDIPLSVDEHQSRPQSNQPESFASTISGLLSGYQSSHQSINTSNAPGDLDRKFQWPTSSPPGETSDTSNATDMQWSSSPTRPTDLPPHSQQ